MGSNDQEKIRIAHEYLMRADQGRPDVVGGSNGYRAALARRQLTPGLISSLPETAGLPPFISFSTSYPELDSAVRCPMRRIGHGGLLGLAITFQRWTSPPFAACDG
jgi:hypothetical protein